MKISRIRIILTILLGVACVIAFGWIVMMQNHATLVKNHTADETLKLEAVTHTLEEIESSWNNMERRIRARFTVNATLSALALRNIIKEKEDDAIALYTSGAVIKITDDGIMAPEGVEKNLGLTAGLFDTREGLFMSPENPKTLVVYSMISSPFYYVEWHEDTSIQELVEDAVDIPGILQKSETAYDVYALCAAEDPSAENSERILYSNDLFTDLEEFFRQNETAEISIEETEQGGPYKSGTLSLQNGTFRYNQSPIPQISGYLVLMAVQPNLYVEALGHSTYMLTALILFLAALYTSGYSLYFFIQKNTLTPVMEKRYRPFNVRRFTCLCGVIGSILIFLSGMMIYALSELYDDTSKGKERLQLLDKNLEMYADRLKINTERFKDIYVDYGAHIAECLDNYPQLREKPVLETLADSISASSITLYDSDGNETISSGEYVGLSLGTDPDSTTYDFRRILNGVPCIVHGLEADEITGQSEVRIGMRILDASNPSRYGVLMIAVDPSLWEYDLKEMTHMVLQNLSGPGTILCIADPETGEILSSSEENLTGRDISSLGLNESHLRESLVKNVQTDEGSYFITSAQLDTYRMVDNIQTEEHAIAYYAAVKTSSAAGMLASALTGSVLFILIFAFIAWLILGRYTDQYFEQYKYTGPVSETGMRWAGIRNYLSSIRPEKTGLITMELIVGLYLTQQIPIANFNTRLSQNSVYYYLNSGSWEKGLNLFALAGILILLGQILLAVILVRLLLAICATFTGSKGKTICRLIKSLIEYVALFTFLILACTYIGISMSVILAAIGTLGIAVSLGAQHFVSDIIAGLTIVFEGNFHVGDIVDLGVGGKQYHGEVLEIGLRFTRLHTRLGNIVTLSNREINMVNNMTQLNTRYECDIAVSTEYSIEDIEKMLQRELPKIGEKDRRILAGPVYSGIIALEDGTMTLCIITECAEEDLTDVQQLVNRSLQCIFRENGYKI